MLESLFNKDSFNKDTFKAGDSFGMDLDQANFGSWKGRLPRLRNDDQSLVEAENDLNETIRDEFSPVPLDMAPTQGLTSDLSPAEQSAVERFETTLEGLKALCNGNDQGDESWQGDPAAEVVARPHMLAAKLCFTAQEKSSKRIFQVRSLVAEFEITDSSGDTRAWLLPDISGHNAAAEEAGLALDPERFEFGPIRLVHLIQSDTSNHEQLLNDSLSPRFSSPAFQEATEHFVAKCAGVPGSASQYSIVEELILNGLEEIYGSGVAINQIELVESRLSGSVFHFVLELDTNSGVKRADVGLFLNANGVAKAEFHKP